MGAKAKLTPQVEFNQSVMKIAVLAKAKKSFRIGSAQSQRQSQEVIVAQ